MSVAALAGAAVLAVALDQASKAAVLRHMPSSTRYCLAPRVWLKPVRNERGGLVPLSNLQAGALWLLAIGGLTVLMSWLPPISDVQTAGLGLVAGGAASNLIDRFLRGAVIDFIEVGCWPTFNPADAAMCVGLALTAGSLL